MKLAHKFILGAFLLASLIWGVGFYAVTVSRRALKDSIENSSATLAANLMDEVDRTIHAAIDDWRVYSAGPLVQRAVKASNQEFEKSQDVQARIDEQDRKWQAVPKETLSPFMKSLLDNELSQALRTRLEALERDDGYRAYGEMFVTNRYGANVAQTGKTTDYRQDDEQWWQRAKEDGVYVHDVQYDESAGVYSTDICVRVDDENGNFIGVIKAVFDIQGIFAILRSRISDSQFVAGHQTRPSLILMTVDKKVIFPSSSSSVGLLDGSRFLKGHDHSHAGHIHTSHRHDEKLGEMLTCCASSQGHGKYKGLGWDLVVEHRAEDILAPVAALRASILMMSVAVTIVGLVLGIGFSLSLSRRISRLKNAAVRVGEGDLNASLNIRGADEIAQLGRCFDQMAKRLSETLVSRRALAEANQRLESEVAERKRAEEELAVLHRQVEFILGATNTGLDIIDSDFNIRYIDPEWQKAYGDPSGRKCYEYFMDRTEVCPDCGIVKALASNAVAVTEEVLPKEGNRPIQVTTIPFQDDKGEWLVAEVNVDIRHRKKVAEELQQRMDELEQFNRQAVGREQRMVDLKREVNEMARKAGVAPPYDLAFAEAGKGVTEDEA